jgi:hypothetical protein
MKEYIYGNNGECSELLNVGDLVLCRPLSLFSGDEVSIFRITKGSGYNIFMLGKNYLYHVQDAYDGDWY